MHIVPTEAHPVTLVVSTLKT